MKKLLLASTILITATTAFAGGRDFIRVVGSSTVYPFTVTVAEFFGKNNPFKTPIVESTGTGSGFKLFCGGVGFDYPDVNNASREIKESEKTLCADNGVTPIEIPIGFDGIVIAADKNSAFNNLTLVQLWQALAEKGKKPTYWSEISPELPNLPIKVLGPPPSSGTRDAFEELGLEKGCLEINSSAFCKDGGMNIRSDGAYIESGENDNLIIEKINKDSTAIGIFGYSFLEENTDRIKGITISNVTPDYDNILNGNYPLSRELYIYVKQEHLNAIPGLKEFIELYVSPEMLDEDGYLADRGLITKQ